MILCILIQMTIDKVEQLFSFVNSFTNIRFNFFFLLSFSHENRHFFSIKSLSKIEMVDKR